MTFLYIPDVLFFTPDLLFRPREYAMGGVVMEPRKMKKRGITAARADSNFNNLLNKSGAEKFIYFHIDFAIYH